MRALTCAACLLAVSAWAGQGDDLFRQTLHGNRDAGVSRVAGLDKGHCLQCHVRQTNPWAQPKALFGANDNTLCFTCHAAATTAGTYGGQAAYTSSAHWSSGQMLWPGPTPAARPAGDQGECLNCHAVHGTKDGIGLVPDLGQVREESLCLTCHDATGPSVKNILGETQKATGHKPANYSQKHTPGENTPAAFAWGTSRHVECVDCHNPHRASYGDAGSNVPTVGVSRVLYAWDGGATFTYASNADPSPLLQYQICYKCHSGYTTLDAGTKDLSRQFDPRAPSFHPVVAPGTNATAAMTTNLAGGTGLPHLAVGDVIECQDCHASDSIPTTVSRVSLYTGTIPRGPHGSANPKLLRAAYRTTGNGTATASANALCFICHSSAPFSGNTATNFTRHAFHASIGLCNECHNDLHGSRLSSGTQDGGFTRLVSFGPTVTASGGRILWTPKSSGTGSCTLTCHGKGHSGLTY
jgi:predicted CXXCH cytochrome family protein